MPHLESTWTHSLTRRDAARALAAFAAGSPLALAQQDPFRDHSRVPAIDELLNAFDFEAVAYAKLPRQAYDYTAYGTDGEFTMRRNREAFSWVDLTPCVQSIAKPDTALTLFGKPHAFPILLSPTAGHLQLHPAAEAATHQGATAARTTMIVSNVASLPINEIAAAAPGPLWFQFYPREDLTAARDTLDRAQAAGCQAIVVTVDQQAPVFERDLHGRHLGPIARRLPARQPAAANPYRISDRRLWYSWKYLDQIREMVKVPMLAKGILTAEDARLCLEHGLDGVYVSNHGGRSLDYAPATLEVLPEIVDAVAGRVPVIFDSGIRRGTDVLKALALGATAVCLGRVPRWGLGAYGAPGVQRVVEILQAEFVQAMAAAGRPNLAALNRTLVRTDFP
ncbi:MAG: alpha-hydroxy-acid oxidizing protein [Bryobacteraceae bacterium]|nr:alpha-hydroxy-acid oxidizing protein [Bryobacteraceae bacterium]